MPPASRAALAIASCLLCASLWAAPAVPGQSKGARAELAAIEKLSETSSPQALLRLEALQVGLGKEVPYELERDMLRASVRLYQDTGHLDQAYSAERALLRLAIDHGDKIGALKARLGLVREMIDQNRAGEARAELERIAVEVPKDAPASLRGLFADVQGNVFNARGQHEKALGAFLLALELAQDEPAASERRAYLYSRIAQVYSNIDNPGKALETARRALKEAHLLPINKGRLQFMEGAALVRLERHPEALAAFRNALDTAERGGLSALEARVRGYMADFYLRDKDYPGAEREARLALASSEAVKDQRLILMAKANLGFALMGQGRMAEGLPYVDFVIDELRKGEVWADVEAMYDEKSRMQQQAGLYMEALATVRQQQALQRTGDRAARDRAIATLQEEFDASQRTRQIEFLHRENRIKEAELGSRRFAQLVTTFAALLTVLASAVVFVLYRRARGSAARLQQLNTQLEFHSMRDALTGLFNRRSFVDKMSLRAANAASERRRPSGDVDCFVLMDIDHFKAINDRWGHAAGDAVLVEVARRLTLAVRDTDMVLRWGGEEFLVYAPGTDPTRLAELVGRVLEAVGSTPVDTGTSSVPVTLSAGVVALPCSGAAVGELDWQAALRLADWALYHGKANGRNQAWIVERLLAPVQAVLAGLEASGHGKLPQGLLDVVRVDGPDPRSSL